MAVLAGIVTANELALVAVAADEVIPGTADVDPYEK